MTLLSFAGQNALAACATLAWLAPGDDGIYGQASRYDVRYSTSPINPANWDLAEKYSARTRPLPPGHEERLVVADLAPNVEYYFAIKACDELGHWSRILTLGPFLTPDLKCDGYTGNVDCSANGSRNLADITRIIDHVYISKLPLCCPAEANTNGSADGNINLADITRLIDHVYLSRRETATCN